ncbi:hypothetical protein OSB04_032072 [Centaurea solstitialis]|uniref:DUF4378 domain-containing protein n=1 Tax=Centaurea solstitialis TaxID=347529 RepID=A0AA38SAA4_9ASTR|nr:hypothetical protein OSB04_032072 [Centaurea solstitialis]
MLTSGDEDAESMMRSLPKSLGRILSLRDYSSVSPGTSPRGDFREVNKSQPLTINDVSEEKVVVLDNMASEGVVETVKLSSCDQEQREKLEDIDISCEPCGSSINDHHEGVVFDGSNEERSSEILKPDLPDENEPSTSQTLIEPPLAVKNIDLEITPGDRTERPSPVSVLEPLFSDDDISPARTVSRPGIRSCDPTVMHPIEEPVSVSVPKDQQIRITDSADSEESEFEYVEAVLLSSDLNWLEFEKRWLSAVQILDPSLFEEVETFSSRARYNQRFLFDSTNEALEEVCDRFIPESSFIKPNVWPVPKGMDLINEVWARLESRFGRVYPRDLNKLVRNDLETSRTWLDLRSESRQIVVEIEESIFEETIDDTLFEFIRDIRD